MTYIKSIIHSNKYYFIVLYFISMHSILLEHYSITYSISVNNYLIINTPQILPLILLLFSF